MANSVDPDQTAPIGAVCSGSTLFASILNLSVMQGNYLQQTTFSDAFFSFGPLRDNKPITILTPCLPSSSSFCHLLITFANNLDPDQDQHNVSHCQDQN